MPKLSKRERANESQLKEHPLLPDEAIAALKKFKGPGFDQTVEVCMHLNIDTKHADQNIRGSMSLPNGIGKSRRVIAFCSEDKIAGALEVGAVKAGGEELVREIEGGWFDFDVAVASPDMMRVVSRLGRVLGPKGLMPSPKAGTVTPNIDEAVKEYAAGKVEYRADKSGNVHGIIGKMSFSDANLVENLAYFIETIEKVRPSAVKGQYIKKISISGTMTPGVQVEHTVVEV